MAGLPACNGVRLTHIRQTCLTAFSRPALACSTAALRLPSMHSLEFTIVVTRNRTTTYRAPCCACKGCLAAWKPLPSMRPPVSAPQDPPPPTPGRPLPLARLAPAKISRTADQAPARLDKTWGLRLCPTPPGPAYAWLTSRATGAWARSAWEARSGVMPNTVVAAASAAMQVGAATLTLCSGVRRGAAVIGSRMWW